MSPSVSGLIRTTSVGRRLKTPVRAALARAGYELMPARAEANTYVAGVLARLGVATVLDIGANQGQYGTWLRRIGFAGSIVSCEPMAEPFRILDRLASRDSRWTALRVAAGEVEDVLSMHVTANSVSSSLLAPTAAQRAAAPESVEVGRENVAVRPLDDIVGELSLEDPTWLKIDTQGFERQVLAGAVGVLKDAMAVQCEISLTELYEGQADYVEVLGLLRDLGFGLVHADPAFVDPVTGDALQLDVLMVRH